MRQDFYVYCWTNTLDGKRYIGKGRGRRAERHLQLALKGAKSCRRFYSAVRKHGAEAFELGYIAQGLGEGTAFAAERAFICMYQTQLFGYNLSEGGEGPSMAEETKKRLSEAKRGRPAPPGAIAYLASINRGRKLSDETKAKIGAANKGRQHTEETKARLSAAHKGKRLSEEHKAALARGGAARVQTEEEKTKRVASNAQRSAKILAEAASRFDGTRMAAFAKANGVCHTNLRPALISLGWVLAGKKWSKKNSP